MSKQITLQFILVTILVTSYIAILESNFTVRPTKVLQTYQLLIGDK